MSGSLDDLARIEWLFKVSSAAVYAYARENGGELVSHDGGQTLATQVGVLLKEMDRQVNGLEFDLELSETNTEALNELVHAVLSSGISIFEAKEVISGRLDDDALLTKFRTLFDQVEPCIPALLEDRCAFASLTQTRLRLSTLKDSCDMWLALSKCHVIPPFISTITEISSDLHREYADDFRGKPVLTHTSVNLDDKMLDEFYTFLVDTCYSAFHDCTFGLHQRLVTRWDDQKLYDDPECETSSWSLLDDLRNEQPYLKYGMMLEGCLSRFSGETHANFDFLNPTSQQCSSKIAELKHVVALFRVLLSFSIMPYRADGDIFQNSMLAKRACCVENNKVYYHLPSGVKFELPLVVGELFVRIVTMLVPWHEKLASIAHINGSSIETTALDIRELSGQYFGRDSAYPRQVFEALMGRYQPTIERINHQEALARLSNRYILKPKKKAVPKGTALKGLSGALVWTQQSNPSTPIPEPLPVPSPDPAPAPVSAPVPAQQSLPPSVKTELTNDRQNVEPVQSPQQIVDRTDLASRVGVSRGNSSSTGAEIVNLSREIIDACGRLTHEPRHIASTHWFREQIITAAKNMADTQQQHSIRHPSVVDISSLASHIEWKKVAMIKAHDMEQMIWVTENIAGYGHVLPPGYKTLVLLPPKPSLVRSFHHHMQAFSDNNNSRAPLDLSTPLPQEMDWDSIRTVQATFDNNGLDRAFQVCNRFKAQNQLARIVIYSSQFISFCNSMEKFSTLLAELDVPVLFLEQNVSLVSVRHIFNAAAQCKPVCALRPCKQLPKFRFTLRVGHASLMTNTLRHELQQLDQPALIYASRWCLDRAREVADDSKNGSSVVLDTDVLSDETDVHKTVVFFGRIRCLEMIIQELLRATEQLNIIVLVPDFMMTREIPTLHKVQVHYTHRFLQTLECRRQFLNAVHSGAPGEKCVENGDIGNNCDNCHGAAAAASRSLRPASSSSLTKVSPKPTRATSSSNESRTTTKHFCLCCELLSGHGPKNHRLCVPKFLSAVERHVAHRHQYAPFKSLMEMYKSAKSSFSKKLELGSTNNAWQRCANCGLGHCIPNCPLIEIMRRNTTILLILVHLNKAGAFETNYQRLKNDNNSLSALSIVNDIILDISARIVARRSLVLAKGMVTTQSVHHLASAFANLRGTDGCIGASFVSLLTDRLNNIS